MISTKSNLSSIAPIFPAKLLCFCCHSKAEIELIDKSRATCPSKSNFDGNLDGNIDAASFGDSPGQRETFGLKSVSSPTSDLIASLDRVQSIFREGSLTFRRFLHSLCSFCCSSNHNMVTISECLGVYWKGC